jgi:hypothetical protein
MNAYIHVGESRDMGARISVLFAQEGFEGRSEPIESVTIPSPSCPLVVAEHLEDLASRIRQVYRHLEPRAGGES